MIHVLASLGILLAHGMQLQVNVPDPPSCACLVNSVQVRAFNVGGGQIDIEGIPLHHGTVVAASCQENPDPPAPPNPNFIGGPTFGADFPLAQPNTFPAGFTDQQKFNTLAIDVSSAPAPGNYWIQVIYSSGAVGSILVYVP